MPETHPGINTNITSIGPLAALSPRLQQPHISQNPPLIPPTSNLLPTAPNNNTNIPSLLHNNPAKSSFLPGISSSLNANTFKPYNNSLYGLSVEYPAGWRAEEGNNFLFRSTVTNVATFVPPGGVTGSRNYHTYVALSIEPTNITSLADYLKYAIGLYSGLPGFTKTGSNTNAVLGGNPAYILQYRDLEPGFPINALEIGTIIGDKAYFISYASDPQTYSNYLPIAYTMIKSVSINSVNTLQNPVSPAQTHILPPSARTSGSLPKY